MKCPINPNHKASKVFETANFIFLKCYSKHQHLEPKLYDRFTKQTFKKDTVFMLEKEVKD